jgi:hypothetical protein
MVEVPGYFSFKNDQYFRKKQIPLSSLLTFKMSFCKNDGSVKMLLVKSDLKTVVKDLIARNRMRRTIYEAKRFLLRSIPFLLFRPRFLFPAITIFCKNLKFFFTNVGNNENNSVY